VSAPLDGVRVLDLSRLLPGPACTLHLADLGADVVKVEDTAAGDYARSLGLAPPHGGNAPSAFFRMINRNKRSLSLDLKADAGRGAFLRVAQRADVIVESFRPGVLDRLGIGYAAVAAINPRIVYCSITGYGQTGPYRDRPGHDINYLGYAGVLDQTGTAGGPPALSNLQVADLLGGALNASTAILAALFAAAKTGNGTHVDVAMTEAAEEFVGPFASWRQVQCTGGDDTARVHARSRDGEGHGRRLGSGSGRRGTLRRIGR